MIIIKVFEKKSFEIDKHFKHQKLRFSNFKHVQGPFLTVPPDFQYQNEKQVAANQDYFFKKFSM